jgi:hypothetical protein
MGFLFNPKHPANIPEAKSQGQGGIEKSQSGPRRDRRRTSSLLNIGKRVFQMFVF